MFHTFWLHPGFFQANTEIQVLVPLTRNWNFQKPIWFRLTRNWNSAYIPISGQTIRFQLYITLCCVLCILCCVLYMSSVPFGVLFQILVGRHLVCYSGYHQCTFSVILWIIRFALWSSILDISILTIQVVFWYPVYHQRSVPFGVPFWILAVCPGSMLKENF